MPPFFRYFWFLAAVIMLVNIFIWKRRLTPLADAPSAMMSFLAIVGWLAVLWWLGAPTSHRRSIGPDR